MLAEEIGFLVGEIDEPAAQVVPEKVVTVRRDRTHHFRDHPLVELPAVKAHEVEPDHRQELRRALSA